MVKELSALKDLVTSLRSSLEKQRTLSKTGDVCFVTIHQSDIELLELVTARMEMSGRVDENTIAGGPK